MAIARPRASFTSGVTVPTQPPLRRIKAILRAARLTGFDVAWTIDHFLGFFPQALWDRQFSWLADPDGTPHAMFDYQPLMGYLADRAGRMRIGVGVTEPIRRHPVQLAQFVMSLAHLTSRPPILGLGAGERENVEPYGLDFVRPVARLEEALQIVRLCFDSRGPFEFRGEFFRLEDAVMDLQAPADRVPHIWLAAHGPRMLRLTGEYADGWYPTFPTTAGRYEADLESIQEAASRAGRDPAGIVPGWQAYAVLANTEAGALALLDNRAIRFSALLVPASTWRDHGLSHPLGDDFHGMIDFVPQRYERGELEAAISKVPIDVVAESALVGTPRLVFEKLTEFVDAGLRHLVLQPGSALASRRDAVFSLRAVAGIQRRLRRMKV